MNDAPLPPPLDDFLHAPPPAAASDALRRDLRDRTTRLVRRRRAVRRLAVAWLAAASVIATLVGWSLWWPTPEPERQVVIVETSNSMNVAPEPPAPPAPTPEPMPPALAKEWQAFDTRGPERVQLLLEAGDRYIADHHDLASAVRCYRQALDAAPDHVLEINPNDNWLVMAMKLDRQKEN
jgi:hypothetical protein